MVDAPGYETAHFLVGEDQVVGFIERDAELLARPFDQVDEVPIAVLHRLSFRPALADFRDRQARILYSQGTKPYGAFHNRYLSALIDGLNSATEAWLKCITEDP